MVDVRLVHRASEVLRRLKSRSMSVITAESCTAGLVSAVLSQVDGASEVLHGGFIAYTKANKTMALGVAADLLSKHGSVNEAAVAALARGALQRSPADLALAVSGVLGPEPDEDGNPVGLVYFRLAQRGGQCRVVRRNFGVLPPDDLRRRTVMTALKLIDEHLTGVDTNAAPRLGARLTNP